MRAHHPLRFIRAILVDAVDALEGFRGALFGAGRPSVAPEMLFRAVLLQAFYSVRSERQLMVRLEFDFLFSWFVGLGWTNRYGTIRPFPRTATGCWQVRSPPNF